MRTLGYYKQVTRVDYDDERQLSRLVDYAGFGWYSMDDSRIYRRGEFATYSRVYIGPREDI